MAIVREDFDATTFRIDLQHVMADVIGDEHFALAIENDSIADAVAGKSDEDFGFSVRSCFADGLLFCEIYRVDVAVGITGGTFDAVSEGTFWREWFSFEKNFRAEGRMHGENGRQYH